MIPSGRSHSPGNATLDSLLVVSTVLTPFGDVGAVALIPPGTLSSHSTPRDTTRTGPTPRPRRRGWSDPSPVLQ
jgi:hypothetical protein